MPSPSLRSALQAGAEQVSRLIALLRRRRMLRHGVDDPVLVAYTGWGTADVLHVRARVLSGPGAVEGSAVDPWWRNALATVRRFMTSEVPGAVVHVQAGGTPATVTTDHDGYARLRVPNTTGATGWVDVEWTLATPPPVDDGPVRARALVPRDDARFLVVSDLDDTVLRTGITSTMTMISTTFFNNAYTRLPFPGVAAFYRALHQDGRNPIFYVSTSPWNLYDLLTGFLALRGIPAGPMFLTDWGIDRQTFIQPETRAHKLDAIDTVLAARPDLPVVLIGDAGQHDPEIYREVGLAHPDRVVAVYIRTLALPGRRPSLERIRTELADVGVPFGFGPDTAAAAEHAARLGLIDPGAVAAVRAAKG